MFGISLGKILFTVALVFIGWRVMTWLKRRGEQPSESRIDRVRRAAEDVTRARAGAHHDQPGETRPNGFAKQPPEAAQAVDMVRCPSCGNWIVPGAVCDCGYKDAR